MKVGYVRVSTTEQNTARQDELMERLGVEKVFTDKVSGQDSNRPALQEMMNYVREGDCLVVESISRFARNTRDLLELIETLNQKNVQFQSNKEAIDTSTATGKFMLTIFGAVAELEREYIRDRQREGIDIAKAEGRFNGRPRKQLDNFDEIYQSWKNKKITASKASKQLGIARSTFYRLVNECEEIIDLD